MDGIPKVSVIIPVYNVEKYLQECLESAINQTLRDIEIICVDDGSTDNSPAILDEYARRDSRLRVVHKSNSGYGQTMNIGISLAKGEFISFLESDDSIEITMLEKLYALAIDFDLDIIKADYFEEYDTGGQQKLEYVQVLSDKARYGKVWEIEGNPWLFYVPMMNCLGLFRLNFLNKNQIRHNETPGASHQDMGFWFQTFCLARNIYYVNEAFYKYRQDNTASSMNTNTKVYCIRDEYQFMFSFLTFHPDIRRWVAPVFYHRMFGSFLFTYRRLVEYLKPLFLHVFSEELNRFSKEKDFSFSRFSNNEKTIALQIMNSPQEYYFLGNNICNDACPYLQELQTATKKLKWYQSEIHNYLQHGHQKDGLKNKAPKVSIIIPVYNTAPYLNEALESITNQTLSDLEIICIDDGSTDNSAEILRKYKANDNRIKVFSQVNLGQSSARNVGLCNATGSYIYFMDSDDRLKPEALETLYMDASQRDLDILYFDGSTFYDNKELENSFGHMKNIYVRPCEYGEIYTGIELFCLLKKDNTYRVSPCLQFIKREHLIRNNLFFYEGIIYEDNLFAFQCILTANRVSHRKLRLFERRIRNDSTTIASLGYRHFYGYFTCYLQMSIFSIKCPIPHEQELMVIDELNVMKQSTIKIYKALDKNEILKLNTLTVVESSFLNKLFLNTNTNDTESLPSITILKERLVAAQNEINNIHLSFSYKIGRFITFFPRKFRGGMRCLKEHGIVYTIQRILFHLGIK